MEVFVEGADVREGAELVITLRAAHILVAIHFELLFDG
jgi:hypothetical protein